MFDYITNNWLGMATITVTLVYMFLGLPSQILKIWARKSVADIQILMFALLFFQSILWMLYGIYVTQKVDWFIVTGNAFGTLFSGIIIVEWFLFRRKEMSDGSRNMA